tara:strand:+ start:972 stop:1319 length:348 start_codon:yes stop_codon:yes gene_type:complete
MSEEKKPNIEKLPDTEVPQFELSDKQKKELDDAWIEVMNEAKKVVDDYANNPSELSGSAIQIHEDSPFVDENLTSHNWNKVVRGNVLDEIVTDAKNILTFGPKKPKKDVDKKKKK